MVQKIRIGIIGAGGIVRERHAPNLREIAEVELSAVCNSTLESGERASRELGIPRVFENWRDLVHDPEIDVVWIGTWPYLHCPITLEALAAKKHVFCQARMAMNLDEARSMLAAARVTDHVAMLCPPPMGMKGDSYMIKTLLQDKTIGDVYSIHLSAMGDHYIDPNAPLTWRQREDLSGFNTLTVGIYAEVIHRWFGYVRNITAQAKTFVAMRPGQKGVPQPVTRPDMVMAIAEMESGALLRCEWSSLAAPKPESILEAYGSRGAIRYHFDSDDLFISTDQKQWKKVELKVSQTREWTVERDFIATVRGEEIELHPNFYDGLKYMELTEAIFRSIQDRRMISLPLIN